MKSLAFGEVLWDIYPTSKHFGGAPMNFAAHFKKCGGEASIVTAIGVDTYGREALEQIQALGIGTQYVSCLKDKETGKCLVTLDENKIPSYNLLNHVAYDYIEKPKLKNEKYDVLYFGTLALRNENNVGVLKDIISENIFDEIAVDVNVRPPYYNDSTIKFALENATILKISDEELPTVMRALGSACECDVKCAEFLSETFKNLKIVIITRADKGSLAYRSFDKALYQTGAKSVEVVSTVGAGDSFTAAFLAKLLKTGDISAALSLATEISAFVVSSKDAIPEYTLSQFE